MRKVFAPLLMLSVTCQLCAADHAKKASEQEVLTAAKQRAALDCTPPKNQYGVPIAGCRYDVSFIDGKWGVLVSTMYLDQHGKVGYQVGGDVLYLFKADGTFLERIRGM